MPRSVALNTSGALNSSGSVYSSRTAHSSRTLACAAVLAFSVALVPPAPADVFVLKTGARLHGEWLNAGESPLRQYVVGLPAGGKVTLSLHQVDEHRRESPEVTEYDRRAPQTGDTVTDQWELAEWCRQHGLVRQQENHLWRVIELDPDHEGARRALGYSEIGGKWVTTRQFFLERGFVYFQGKWRLPQEVDVLEERRALERQQRDWFGRLKTWRGQLGTERDADAIRQIKAIQDPTALKALTEYLGREKVPRVRELFVHALANIRSAGALELLIQTALRDPDPEVFHTAVDKIVSFEVPGLARKLSDSLRDPNNQRVNRAAHILGRLGDRRAIPALTAALVTTHHLPAVPQRATSATFVQPLPASGGTGTPLPSAAGGDHGMAFTAGRQAKTVPYQVANQEVLTALVTLSGGQSYGFDQRAWMHWWASASRRPGP